MTAFHGEERLSSEAPSSQDDFQCTRSSLSDWARMRRHRTANYRAARRRELELAPVYLPLINDGNFSWDRQSFRVVSNSEDPVACMTVVGDDEVWCAAGRQICVLSRRQSRFLACDAVIQLQGFRATQMVHLNGGVWITDDRQSCVWRYDVNTRDCTTALDCCTILPSAFFPCPVPLCLDSDRSEMRIPPTVPRPSSKELRDPLVPEELNLGASSSSPGGIQPHTASRQIKAAMRASPLASRERDFTTSPEKTQTQITWTSEQTTERRRACQQNSSSPEPTDLPTQTNIKAIAVVGDTLWLGRQSGDILVVAWSASDDFYVALGCLNLQQTSPHCGHPIRSLTPLTCGLVVASRGPRIQEQHRANLLDSGVHSDYVMVDNDNPHNDYEDNTILLDVWEAWTSREFNWFSHQQERLY